MRGAVRDAGVASCSAGATFLLRLGCAREVGPLTWVQSERRNVCGNTQACVSGLKAIRVLRDLSEPPTDPIGRGSVGAPDHAGAWTSQMAPKGRDGTSSLSAPVLGLGRAPLRRAFAEQLVDHGSRTEWAGIAK